MTAAPSPPTLEPLYTINEITRLAKRSRSSLRRDIADGRLRVVHIGGSVRVTTGEARRYLTGGGDDTTG